jgi:pyrroline-5-carboxylate reductase
VKSDRAAAKKRRGKNRAGKSIAGKVKKKEMRKRITTPREKKDHAREYMKNRNSDHSQIWTTTTKIVVVGQRPEDLESQLMAPDDHIFTWSLGSGH